MNRKVQGTWKVWDKNGKSLPNIEYKIFEEFYENKQRSCIGTYNGEIKDGDKIMFTAVGAGWAWGSLLMKYDKPIDEDDFILMH